MTLLTWMLIYGLVGTLMWFYTMGVIGRMRNELLLLAKDQTTTSSEREKNYKYYKQSDTVAYVVYKLAILIVVLWPVFMFFAFIPKKGAKA